MALSSVSVVAFADETATAGTNASVTKAELKEIVDDLKSFYEEEIENYGATQAGQFEDAYKHAKKVSADSKATEEDATAAYQMLMAVKNSMKTYTKVELEDLLDECKDDYDTENKLNADIKEVGNIYTDDTWDAFKVAYEDAERCVEYDSGRDITELYVELKDAHKALEALKSVTKTEFRAAQKNYEAILKSTEKYETWRRGKFTVNATTGGATWTNGDDEEIALDLTKANIAENITFDNLLNTVIGTSNVTFQTDDEEGDMDLDANTTWIKIAFAGGDIDTVAEGVEAASDLFDSFEKTNVTTNVEIRGAYEAMLEAVKVFNGWKVDKYNFARQSAVEEALDDYNDALVKEYATKTADTVFAKSIIDITNMSDYVEVKDNELVLKVACTAGEAGNAAVKAIVMDPNTGKIQITPADGTYSATASGKTLADYVKDSQLVKGFKLTPYVPVVPAMITGNADLKNAVELAQLYLTEAGKETPAFVANCQAKFDDLTVGGEKLDSNNTLDTSKLEGASPEWTLINRALRYALSDQFDKEEVVTNEYKRKDVDALIAKCYDLAEEVGDFSMFNAEYNELVEARKGAIEWLRAADAYAKKVGKTYTDKEATKAVPVAYVDTDYRIGYLGARDTNLTVNDLTVGDGQSATAVYEALEGVYNNLADQYKFYNVSYGEIAEKIADVAEGIDSGVYGDTVAVALADVAFNLATLKVSTEGNEAFTKNVLNKYNRLYVNDDATDSEKALGAALEALDKAIEEAGTENPDVVLGDLDGDNVATSKDALMIVQAAVGLITLTDDQKAAADFNKDGKVTSDDALAIVKAALGLN